MELVLQRLGIQRIGAMSLAVYKRTLISWKTLKKLAAAFFQAFGLLAIILSVLDIFFPKVFNFGYEGLLLFSGISLAWALYKVIPGREVSRQLTVPDSKISIKIGDLFAQDAHLVIGMNDVFDTEKGDIIKPSSIQGQFLTRVYNDDRSRLDKDLENALRGLTCKLDAHKIRGKNKRYPIGTVATVTVGAKKYFCVAYSRMGNDLRVQSDVKRLSTSLDMLWEEIRLKGQCERVAMAVVGSDLARLGNTVSHSTLIKLIVSSFILASREKLITHELVIVIHKSNMDKVNIVDINEFLQNF